MPRTSNWNPAEFPLHKLINRLDVLAIAWHRYVQLSFHLVEERPDEMIALYNRMEAEYSEIKSRVFDSKLGFPNSIYRRIISQIIASCPTVDKQVLGKVESWIGQILLQRPPRYNKLLPLPWMRSETQTELSEAHKRFDADWEYWSQYHTLRAELIRMLAESFSMTLPEAIDERAELAHVNFSPESANAEIQQRLLAMLDEETEPVTSKHGSAANSDNFVAQLPAATSFDYTKPAACRAYLKAHYGNYLDVQDLDRVQVSVENLHQETEWIDTYRTRLDESSVTDNSHVYRILNTWDNVLDVLARLSSVDEKLRHSITFNLPDGIRPQTTAWLLEVNVLSAWHILERARQLDHLYRAYVTAAARHRGVIGPGAELTDAAERELRFIVRPPLERIPEAEPASVNGAASSAASTAQTGEQKSEGEKSAGHRKRMTLAEANILVRDYLLEHAKDNPASITRDGVADATGVSCGQVSNTVAWKVFSERRDAEAKPGAREVPLNDQMHATMPGKDKRPDELAAEAEEAKIAAIDEIVKAGKRENAEQERRHKRRQKPS